jgi:hypothetical protein
VADVTADEATRALDEIAHDLITGRDRNAGDDIATIQRFISQHAEPVESVDDVAKAVADAIEEHTRAVIAFVSAVSVPAIDAHRETMIARREDVAAALTRLVRR